MLELLLRATDETPQPRHGDHDAVGDDRLGRAGRADPARVRRRRRAVAPGVAAVGAAERRGSDAARRRGPGIGGARTRTRRRAADAPCPTCPGARAGPGGASAFPVARGAAVMRPRDTAARGAAAPGRGRGRGAGRPALRLTREPAIASLTAANAGDLSSRATDVLARLEWPGKPGMAAAATPLTAVEQARFDAGRTVYQNICQACHQPDGRGARQARAAARRLRVRAGRIPRHPDPHRPQRQGGHRRADAAARLDPERRADRRRCSPTSGASGGTRRLRSIRPPSRRRGRRPRAAPNRGPRMNYPS